MSLIDNVLSEMRERELKEQIERGKFPPEEYTIRRGENASIDYIGTWRKKTALLIAAQLRKDGFRVAARGRGKRATKGLSADCCPIKKATHLALYVRNAEVIEIGTTEVEGSEVTSDEGVVASKGISRLEALKRELHPA